MQAAAQAPCPSRTSEPQLSPGAQAPPHCTPHPPPRTPLILHLGCVAHQSAKWQAPPEQWMANPASVSVSVHGEARAGCGVMLEGPRGALLALLPVTCGRVRKPRRPQLGQRRAQSVPGLAHALTRPLFPSPSQAGPPKSPSSATPPPSWLLSFSHYQLYTHPSIPPPPCRLGLPDPLPALLHRRRGRVPRVCGPRPLCAGRAPAAQGLPAAGHRVSCVAAGCTGGGVGGGMGGCVAGCVAGCMAG